MVINEKIENTKENALRILEDALLEKKIGEFEAIYDAGKILGARKQFACYGADSELDKVMENILLLKRPATMINSKNKWKMDLYERDISILDKILEKNPSYLGICHNAELKVVSDPKKICYDIAEFMVDNLSELITCEQTYIIDYLGEKEKNELKQDLANDFNLPEEEREIFKGLHYAITRDNIKSGGGYVDFMKFSEDRGQFLLINHNVSMDNEVCSDIGMNLDSACELVNYFKSKGYGPSFRMVHLNNWELK